MFFFPTKKLGYTHIRYVKYVQEWIVLIKVDGPASTLTPPYKLMHILCCYTVYNARPRWTMQYRIVMEYTVCVCVCGRYCLGTLLAKCEDNCYEGSS